jgi:hypothetical protein
MGSMRQHQEKGALSTIPNDYSKTELENMQAPTIRDFLKSPMRAHMDFWQLKG